MYQIPIKSPVLGICVEKFVGKFGICDTYTAPGAEEGIFVCLPIYIPELSHCPLLMLTNHGLDSRKIQVPPQRFFDVCDKWFPPVIQLDGIRWRINMLLWMGECLKFFTVQGDVSTLLANMFRGDRRCRLTR
jgi:hypothetical protein